MIPCEHEVLLSLYTQIAPGALFRQIQRNLGVNVHDGIYTARVSIWMMLAERLDSRGTVAHSVEQLAEGRFDGLLSQCKRARQRRIALSTGGYCQAREHLPKMLVERVMEELVGKLRQTLRSRLGGGLDEPVYVIDGSSVELQDARLVDDFPPARNQHGEAHWPLVQIVVLHDVKTGLAERPFWAPKYGPAALSEQALAERALDALPPGSTVIADRNFGIFQTAYACHLRGQKTIVRLTEKRAKSLVANLYAAEEHKIVWKPSRFERHKSPHLPDDAMVAGRLIVVRVGRGKHKQWLYLFTTLALPAAALVALYAQRWNIETDLSSLKQTCRLGRINVRSSDMLDKELVAAVLGYNLVRAIMCLAAKVARVAPRQLSFTRAYSIVHDCYDRILNASTHQQQLNEFERVIALVAQCKLYRRTKRRSYPRRTWNTRHPYPTHHPNETKRH